jgi:hypothetical protein
VAFTEGQDAVGEFGPGGKDESFGEAALIERLARENPTWGMLVACVRRNCRQLVSVGRASAGGIRRRRRIRRIVEAPTRWPSLSSSPSILM